MVLIMIPVVTRTVAPKLLLQTSRYALPRTETLFTRTVHKTSQQTFAGLDLSAPPMRFSSQGKSEKTNTSYKVLPWVLLAAGLGTTQGLAHADDTPSSQSTQKKLPLNPAHQAHQLFSSLFPSFVSSDFPKSLRASQIPSFPVTASSLLTATRIYQNITPQFTRPTPLIFSEASGQDPQKSILQLSQLFPSALSLQWHCLSSQFNILSQVMLASTPVSQGPLIEELSEGEDSCDFSSHDAAIEELSGEESCESSALLVNTDREALDSRVGFQKALSSYKFQNLSYLIFHLSQNNARLALITGSALRPDFFMLKTSQLISSSLVLSQGFPSTLTGPREILEEASHDIQRLPSFTLSIEISPQIIALIQSLFMRNHNFTSSSPQKHILSPALQRSKHQSPINLSPIPRFLTPSSPQTLSPPFSTSLFTTSFKELDSTHSAQRNLNTAFDEAANIRTRVQTDLQQTETSEENPLFHKLYAGKYADLSSEEIATITNPIHLAGIARCQGLASLSQEQIERLNEEFIRSLNLNDCRNLPPKARAKLSLVQQIQLIARKVFETIEIVFSYSKYSLAVPYYLLKPWAYLDFEVYCENQFEDLDHNIERISKIWSQPYLA